MKIIQTATFETDNAPWTSNSGLCHSYSGTRVSTFKKSGTQSFRAELNDTDSNCNFGMRAELSNRFLALATYENWFSLDIYYPAGKLHDTLPETHFQMHDNANIGSPYWGLTLIKDRLYIGTNVYNQVTGVNIFKAWDIGSAVKGQWQTYTIYHNCKNDGTGTTKFYLNGQIIIGQPVVPSYGANIGSPEAMDFTGITNLSTKTDGTPDGFPYLKFGIYKWQWPATAHTVTQSVVYFDNVSIGNNECQLSDFYTPANARRFKNHPDN